MNVVLGRGAFLTGVGIAIVAGLLPQWQLPVVTWILAVLGIMVGLLNITAKEVNQFLLASAVLLIASSAAKGLIDLGIIVSAILNNIVAFVFPAALLVSLKVIWALARTK